MDKIKKNLLIGLSAFALVVIFSYFFWRNNLMLTIAFLILSAFALALSDKEERFVYLAGFLLFPILDITVVRTGIWTYGNPTLIGIPIWLPPAYALGSLIIIKVGKSLYSLM